jgi:hypothetical protein
MYGVASATQPGYGTRAVTPFRGMLGPKSPLFAAISPVPKRFLLQKKVGDNVSHSPPLGLCQLSSFITNVDLSQAKAD